MPPQNVNAINTITPVKKKFPIGIFIAIFGVILLIVIGFALFKKFTGNNSGSTTGELTWWGLWEDPNIVTPLISEYERTHPGVKITYVKQSPKDYRERLTSAFAKASGPDIFMF